MSIIREQAHLRWSTARLHQEQILPSTSSNESSIDTVVHNTSAARSDEVVVMVNHTLRTPTSNHDTGTTRPESSVDTVVHDTDAARPDGVVVMVDHTMRTPTGNHDTGTTDPRTPSTAGTGRTPRRSPGSIRTPGRDPGPHRIILGQSSRFSDSLFAEGARPTYNLVVERLGTPTVPDNETVIKALIRYLQKLHLVYMAVCNQYSDNYCFSFHQYKGLLKLCASCVLVPEDLVLLARNGTGTLQYNIPGAGPIFTSIIHALCSGRSIRRCNMTFRVSVRRSMYGGGLPRAIRNRNPSRSQSRDEVFISVHDLMSYIRID